MTKVFKFAEVTFAVSGVAVFMASWIMSLWLWETMPTTPDIKTGFVIPMINHGHTIYLSHYCYTIFNMLFWGGFALFFAAILIDFFKDPFHRRNIKK